MTDQETLGLVRERYAAAARAVSTGSLSAVATSCCGAPTGAAGGDIGCCGTPCEATVFGPALYSPDLREQLPVRAVEASLGCGNPTAVADLLPGDRVLDLGSGGGIDVLLSARRVGPSGFAYGVDITTEMLDLARHNAAEAGVENVEFLHGAIEEVPLPDASVDVVISNCVVNLSGDKAAVVAEMYRVLVPGGRVGISDVVAEDHLTAADRAQRGSRVGCVAGALSRAEYLAGLTAAGFVAASVEFTHEVTPGMHGAIVRARKPGV